ncbi:MAG: hypothetical protein OXH34_03975 [Bacteroidetes bacterium]|nr:hypothetical protein [Bacteroidota bacterium]
MERFEGNLHLHSRNAVSVIGRIKDDGYEYFDMGSAPLKRWQKYCQDLQDFISRELPVRNHNGQDLVTVLREFFQEFEHSSYGLDEMIHKVALDRGDEGVIVDLWDWLSLAHRNSVYAIVACWAPDKKQVDTCHIEINVSAGTSSQKWTREEMEVPKRYKRATKRP